MFSNIITFTTLDEFYEDKEIHPIPSKLNIPSWFKELNHEINNFTIKGCMPVLDSLTAGYILKMPVDYYFEFNQKKDDNFYTAYKSSMFEKNDWVNSGEFSGHNTIQIGEKCPYFKKNKGNVVHKIINPWFISTPPGYSCLFLPPMHNTDDRFSIIPGIVDTDTFEERINFPIVFNGDKYPTLKSTIKYGTPFVQVIPFKREGWKMKIKGVKNIKPIKKLTYFKRVIHNYKNLYWNKKSWK